MEVITRSKLLIGVFVLLPLTKAFAAGEPQDVLVAHEVTRLLIQLGIIILGAKAGGSLVRRLGLPALLGEVGMGLILSPYALGSLPVPGFEDGLIPLQAGAFPLAIQLYAFAAVGAVIHVLAVGLESDIALFGKTRQRGFAIALGSSILSLLAGLFFANFWLDALIPDRRVFFFAALSISTSLGVQARILHAQKRMASPEGGAIVSASLLQDGFAIIFLAIAMAIGGFELGRQADVSIWYAVIPVTLRALAILGVGTFIAIKGTPILAKFFRSRGSPNFFVVIVVASAMALSGFFEVFGVAAIIGAYIIGIAFSRTDAGDLLAEKSQPISEFFVPVLYVVMGMLVDFRALVNPTILLPGLGFALLSGLAKIAGSAIPALVGGFTLRGGIRIGLGTVPRGEVALIIASVGLALGLFSVEVFQVMVVMIVFSVGLGAPLFALAMMRGGSGTRGGWGAVESEVSELNLPNEEMTDLIIDGLVRVAEDDGFFVHRLELAGQAWRLRRDEVYITIYRHPSKIEMVTSTQDMKLAKTLLYEVIVHVRDRMSRITELVVPQELRRDAAAGSDRGRLELAAYLDPLAVVLPLANQGKEAILQELVEALARAGRVLDKVVVLQDVLAREASVATGMEHGIAIPHARTAGVATLAIAVGICPQGADFGALDGQPSTIILLLASPEHEHGPHLQVLASIAKVLRDGEKRKALLASRSPEEVLAVLGGK